MVIAASIGGTSIYGPLATPIVILIWLYVLAIAVLIGAALNAAVDQLFPHPARVAARRRPAPPGRARRPMTPIRPTGGDVDAPRESPDGAGDVDAPRESPDGAGDVDAPRESPDGAGDVDAPRESPDGAGDVDAPRESPDGAGDVDAPRESPDGAGDVAPISDR